MTLSGMIWWLKKIKNFILFNVKALKQKMELFHFVLVVEQKEKYMII